MGNDVSQINELRHPYTVVKREMDWTKLEDYVKRFKVGHMYTNVMRVSFNNIFHFKPDRQNGLCDIAVVVK